MRSVPRCLLASEGQSETKKNCRQLFIALQNADFCCAKVLKVRLRTTRTAHALARVRVLNSTRTDVDECLPLFRVPFLSRCVRVNRPHHVLFYNLHLHIAGFPTGFR